MLRSLRKGTTSIDLEYDLVNDTIFTINTGASIEEGVLTIHTELKPAGSNQLDDIERLQDLASYPLKAVVFSDEQITKNLMKYVNAQAESPRKVYVELSYRKKIRFPVTLSDPYDETLRFVAIENPAVA